MHSHSHAACIYQHSTSCSISKVLHTTSFYTNQLLHQPAFTQTLFYTKHFLQKPAFTPTSFYTNPLLHKLAFPQTTFYTNQLLHKRGYTNQAFTPTSFYTNQLFDKQHLLHKPPLHQPALHNPCFGPVGQRREGRRNAQGLNNWNKGEYPLAQAHLQMWSSVLAHREPSMVEHTSQRNNANTMSAQSQPNKTLGPWDLVLPFNNLVKSLNCAECDIVIPRHAGTSQESRRVCTLPGATRWLYNRRFYHFFEIFEKELSVVCCPAHPSE